MDVTETDSPEGNFKELRRRHLPLFDTERFTRHLEQAFETMAARAKAGLAPQAFDVPPLPPLTTLFD